MNQNKINQYFTLQPTVFRSLIDVDGDGKGETGGQLSAYIKLNDTRVMKILDYDYITEDQEKSLRQITYDEPRQYEMKAINKAKATDYCKICGECADWVDYHNIRHKHNKKNCPYNYYYGINNIHYYKRFMIQVEDELDKQNNKMDTLLLI